MSKPGPKPLPIELRRHVRVTVRLRPAVADAMFVLAGRRRQTLSEVTRDLYERLLAHHQRIASDNNRENTPPPPKIDL